MLDTSFTRKTLSRFILESDYSRFRLIDEENTNLRLDILAKGINEGEDFFQFSKATIKGRAVAQPASFESAIVTRKLHHDLKKITNIKQANRSIIIRRIKLLMSEGVPYTIVRLDIKKFYQTIDINALRDMVNNATKSTYAIQRVANKFLDWCARNGSGVPPGIALSGLLSELYMESFDMNVVQHSGTRFYARFVDDIILIMSPDVEKKSLATFLKQNLPPGLEFNSDPEKYYYKKVSTAPERGAKHCATFDYLGYYFSVEGITNSQSGAIRSSSRVVKTDISKKKIERRKKRFIYALLSYFKDNDAQKLARRYLLLNSGYEFIDYGRNCKRLAGICNTYPEIDFPSAALADLQRFYHATLLSPKSSFSGRLKLAPIPRSQRRQILALNLQGHVQKKRHIHFPDTELTKLNECWRHV